MEQFVAEFHQRCRPILFEKCCGYTFVSFFEEGDVVDEAFRAVERYFGLERGEIELYADPERQHPLARSRQTPLATVYRTLTPVYPMPARVVYRLYVGGICERHE